MIEPKNTFITKISLFFINKSRITIFLTIFLLFFGFFTYTNLLKREGFPAIQVPFVLVNTSYFVGDANIVNDKITSPIEKSISDIKDIKSVSSTSNKNFSSVFIEFNQDVDSEVAKSLVRDEVAKDVVLPENSNIQFQTFSANTFDGENNFILSLSANKPVEVLQDKAHQIALELEVLDTVDTAKTLDLIKTETNPKTGETFKHRSGFNNSGFRSNGHLIFKPSIAIGIVQTKDAGTIELSEEIRNKISLLQKKGDLDGYEVVYTGDLAVALNEQISTLENSALYGLLVIILLILLLINWRAAIVLSVFLLLTMGMVFLAFYVAGYSLNVLSLFALILVLGIFMDDGTIVVEAIDYYKNKGFKGISAIKKALNDIGVADLAGTITTLIVFVPMMFIGGILGDFIKLIPSTVILSMAISLLVALTIVPFLSRIILIPGTKGVLSNFINKVSKSLAVLVYKYLQNKIRIFSVIFSTIVLIILGGFFATKVPFAVFSSPDDTVQINIKSSYPVGYVLEDAERDANAVEQIISNKIGKYVDWASYYFANEKESFLVLNLIDSSKREVTSKELVIQLNEIFKENKGTQVVVEQVANGPQSEIFPYKMQIFSDDLDKLKVSSEKISSFIKNQKFEGEIEVLETKLSDLSNINKKDGQRYIEISARFNTTPDTGTILELKDRVNNQFNQKELEILGLTEKALGFDFGQEQENLDSFNSAIVAMVVSIFLIYLILLLQFNSFLEPLLILLAIPFAIPGVFPGLYFTGNSLSFFSVLGIIALAGVVVNNTIMLMEYTNHELNKGKNPRESIARAVQIRFRPIITTTATTIGSLLPLAFADPFWEPLVFTLIFGLASSVILILFAFPAFYIIVKGIRTRADRLFVIPD